MAYQYITLFATLFDSIVITCFTYWLVELDSSLLTSKTAVNTTVSTQGPLTTYSSSFSIQFFCLFLTLIVTTVHPTLCWCNDPLSLQESCKFQDLFLVNIIDRLRQSSYTELSPCNRRISFSLVYIHGFPRFQDHRTVRNLDFVKMLNNSCSLQFQMVSPTGACSQTHFRHFPLSLTHTELASCYKIPNISLGNRPLIAQ